MMKRTFVLFLSVILSCLTITLYAADTKTLAKEANARFRAIDNSNDDAACKVLLQEAKGLMDQIAAQDPQSPDLMMLNSKYKRAATRFKVAEPITKSVPSVEADVQPAPSADASANREQVIKEWEAFVQLCKEFGQKVDRTFTTTGNIIYDPSNAEPVFALIADVKQNDLPRLTKALTDFAAKYGSTQNDIDRKLFDLTPLDNRYGMYDERNKRPDDSAGSCYVELQARIANINEAPKAEAKLILKQTIDTKLGDMSFYMDTVRDSKYAEAEADLQLALRFNPDDEEIKALLAKTQMERKQSVGDIEKALDAATFPASIQNFAGPGNPKELIDATLEYFNKVYSNEKAIAACVAGNWISAKQDILGQTIQWGLPVYVASLQGGSTDVARVFKMTVLTAQGSGVEKSTPFEDHWTGDSYRMRAKNVPRN